MIEHLFILYLPYSIFFVIWLVFSLNREGSSVLWLKPHGWAGIEDVLIMWFLMMIECERISSLVSACHLIILLLQLQIIDGKWAILSENNCWAMVCGILETA